MLLPYTALHDFPTAECFNPKASTWRPSRIGAAGVLDADDRAR